MALDAFGGVLTAQQIVAAARRRAGSPDMHLDDAGNETTDAPAYVELQMILDHLAMAWDWPFGRVARTFNIAIGDRTTELPTDFWRVSFDDPMWLVDCDNGRSRLHNADEGVFFDRLGVTGLSLARPTQVFIQKSSGLIFVDPIPDQVYAIEVHFQPWQIPLSGTDSKPWFPWSEYLVSALATKLALTQDDSRSAQEAALASKLMKEIRHSISDQGERIANVQLNPQFYRRPIRL